MLAVVFALSAVVVAPASAKLTKHQKAHIRHKLMRQIKHNPKLIRSKRFIKKASLVNFQLPVTVRLRNATNDIPLQAAGQTAPLSSTLNPNKATLDLGASLGQREVDLGGRLPAVISFHDSFDGGALGNVSLSLKPGGQLTSTSIPLLWNEQVSDPASTWDNALTGDQNPGCGNFTGNADLPNVLTGIGFPWFSTNDVAQTPIPAQLALRPAAYLNSIIANPTNPAAWDNSKFDFGGTSVTGQNIPEKPGVDGLNKLQAWKTPGVPSYLGGQVDPFPSGQEPTSGTPDFQDTVLRTGPLTLKVANVGEQTAPVADGDGPIGTDHINVGPSGGEANLFGDIPGKDYGIDVTVSLEAEIASIVRTVDADALPLIQGQKWPGAAFQCRQAWTGYVHNVLPGIRLKGDLRISPAITKDGKLRIAKATLEQLGAPTQIAVAACLSPYDTFAKANQSNTLITNNPAGLPVNETLENYPAAFDAGGNLTTPAGPATTVRCDDTATTLVQNAHFGGLNAPSSEFAPLTNSGAAVSVAAGLTVDKVEADVLIGDSTTTTFVP
jgi:hypothetical protein